MDTPQLPGAGAPADATAPRRTRLIPDDQNTLSDLMTRVAKSAAGSSYILDWKTPAEATQLGLDFAASIATREELGAGRESKSARIRILQAELNKGATQVKAYINEEWEEDAEAESHYASFGLEGDDDALPDAQQARIKAINTLLLPALLAHGMGTRKYGTAWWTPRLAEYTALANQGTDTAQAVAEVMEVKNPLEDEVRLYLTKFDALLFAQTRTDDQYLALRRKMGYLKEDN